MPDSDDYFADTNIVSRWILPSDAHYKEIRHAILTLNAQERNIYTSAQVLIEFHALATRPVAANGLGWTAQKARQEAQHIEFAFPLLPETNAVYQNWRSLIDTYGVIGRQVYDARLVAVMQAHGVSHILTLNAPHFRRFSGITVVEPKDIK